MNDKFKRKIFDGVEVLNIMVGEVEEFKNRWLCVFVWLNEVKDVGKIIEVFFLICFFFIFLVLFDDIGVGVEIGWCFGILMIDEVRICIFWF